MKWYIAPLLLVFYSCSQSGSANENQSQATEAPEVIAEAATDQVDSVQVQNLLNRYACASCHSMESKPVGPGWPEIAARDYSVEQFKTLVANPQPENWPDYTPMAPMGYVPESDLTLIYQWVKTLEK